MPLALADLVDREFTLALGGGGALGFAHVGVLQALEERGLRPAAVAGTSMGAVVGATYALRGAAADWGLLRRSGRRAFVMAVLSRGASYRRLLRDHFELHRGRDATIADCTIPFIACVARAWSPNVPVYLDDGELPLWEVVAASSALPMMMASVKVGDVRLRDGGTADNMPAAALHKFGLPVVGVELGFLHRGRERKRWEEWAMGLFGVGARYEDLGDILLQPDVSRFSPESFGDFDALVEAGRECVGKALQ
jgi:NTE family protein